MNWHRFFTREFYTGKRIAWGVVILIVVLIVILRIFDNGAPDNIQTTVLTRQHVEQTVLSTGQVVSGVDLALSFQASGVVRQVLVVEGQQVQAGQTLATLDQASALAAVTSAQGTLAQARANYNKILAGASSEDIDVSKAAVIAAETTLTNTYSALLNSGLEAIPSTGNTSDATITITGTYDGTEQGQYRIFVEGLDYRVLGRDVETVSGAQEGDIKRGVPIKIGTRGLYITFSSTGNFISGDMWIINIPNAQASTYLTNLNAYEAAKKSLEQVQAALVLKQAEARTPDLEAAQAQILSAQGQVAAAQAVYDQTVLTAPAPGTITDVSVKIGEHAIAFQEVIVLQDVNDLYVESNVSEADIASIQSEQDVDYTFDALGPDRHFAGQVRTVNPASTVISGVVNYKVTASVDDISEIKPGMTANMTVMVAQKESVLAVLSIAIINREGKKYVRVVDNPNTKSYHEIEVQTGLNADGGLVEILGGLEESQEIVINIF